LVKDRSTRAGTLWGGIEGCLGARYATESRADT
jgi:hypothetical protein